MREKKDAIINDDLIKQNTWVLVASRTGACLFNTSALAHDVTLIQEIENETGRLKNQDINADRGGRGLSRFGLAGDSKMKQNTPVKVETQKFIKSLATILDLGRSQGKFDDLILVAEPQFLGVLKSSLNPKISSCIIASFKKNLMNHRNHKVRDALNELIWPGNHRSDRVMIRP